MPRDTNGVYSLPPGYLAISGEDILPEQHNLSLQDVATAITGSLPRNGSASMTADFPMGGNKITGMADGVASSDAATKGQVDAAVSAAAIAPGIVSVYAGATAPLGWLLCHGQAVSRTTYAALFAAIATTFGTGDGSTTFNVPDLRGEFVRGLDAGRGVDASRTLGSAQAGEVGAHTHTATSTVTDPGHTHTMATWAANLSASGPTIEVITAPFGGPSDGHTSNSSTTGITVATTVNANTGAETRPRNVALSYIIKH